MAGGLQSAAQQLQAYGRGPDTMLAHISPDEAKLIDYLQGGRKTNPTTGLPEYGAFGNILKTLVRVGATMGAFIASGGNPLAAAAANAAATKLTGGSWKQAGIGAATAGLTAGAGNMLGGVGFMGSTGLSGAAANSVPLSQLGTVASQTALPTGITGSLAGATSGIGGLGGVGAGLGSFMAEPRAQPSAGDAPPPLAPENINPSMMALDRGYTPYTGDYSTYGERGGHKFFRNVNPHPGVPSVNAQPAPSPEEYMPQGYAEGGIVTPAALQQAARAGYNAAFKRGGSVHGPRGPRAPSAAAMMGRVHGPGTETSDSVPAMLSRGEHVLDSEVVRLKGRGNVERGHQVIEKEKRALRKQAGIPAPYKPEAARMTRAKRKAGIK